jgi:hypothetical protein
MGQQNNRNIMIGWRKRTQQNDGQQHFLKNCGKYRGTCGNIEMTSSIILHRLLLSASMQGLMHSLPLSITAHEQLLKETDDGSAVPKQLSLPNPSTTNCNG